ncbi:MAG TPA: hypothetical protein VK530_05625 [Candidatus Acidoferrum sp.]|nr:hypothetical protein [Candidatus Acidoferrum sp.]
MNLQHHVFEITHVGARTFFTIVQAFIVGIPISTAPLNTINSCATFLRMNGLLIRLISVCCALLVLCAGVGCHSIQPMPVANLSEPGWKVQHGQGVWRASEDAPEIAGEILFATHRDGRTVLHFAKNPIPFVNVQTSNALWRVEFVPQQKTFSGKGAPTTRLIWVHLSRALSGEKTQSPLRLKRQSQGEFTFENSSTGESISGFLQ